MSRLKRLIHEIHRRSLWQVLSVYLVSSWVTLQVADTVTAALGLPDWVPQAALVLLIVLLPVVLATAFVQEGVGGARAEPAPEAEKAEGEPTPELSIPEPRGAHHRVLTWRNAVAAAVVMLALLTVSAGGYMGLRAAGIGPFASLMSKGVLEERDLIVLADFENRTPDSLLAIAATELFHTALRQSLVVNVAGQGYVAGVLRQMEKDPGVALDYDLAREVAIRKGLRAVVAGEIISVGSGYVVSARLVAAAEGVELWKDSETARDSQALFDAIDALSRRLRERIGESLRTIRPSEPLANVTTSSLDALKKFSQAQRATLIEGDYSTAIRLAEEAVRLDTLFARGYWTLGTALYISGAPRSKWFGAWQSAFKLRDRLPELSRYSLEGFYYKWGTEEYDKALAAYRARLAIDPDYRDNNLATLYSALRDFERAEAMLRRLIEEDSVESSPPFVNLAVAQVAQGKLREASLTLEQFGEKLPDNPARKLCASQFAAAQGKYDEAEAHLLARRERWKDDASLRANTGEWLATLARQRGQLAKAEDYIREAMRIQERQGQTRALIMNATVLGRTDRQFREDTAAALRSMEEALARFPLDSMPLADRPYVRLVDFYAWAGDPERAKVYMAGLEAQSELMGLSTFELYRRYSLGKIALAEGRALDAIEEFRMADAHTSCTMCVFIYLPLAFELANEPDSAIVYYERYVTTPWLNRMWNDSWWLAFTYERLGDLYQQRGDTAKAIYYYGKLVDLWKDADPELQPRVEAARRAIEALSPDT